MITLSQLSLVAACPGSALLPRARREGMHGAPIGRAIHALAQGRVEGRADDVEGIATAHELAPDDAGRLAFLATHLRLPIPAGALAEVSLGYFPDGTVRRIEGGAGEYPDAGQWLSGQLDVMWAEPCGIARLAFEPDRAEVSPGSTLWLVDYKTGGDDHVPPIARNWQLRGGAVLAARWTGAQRVIPAICYINAAECAEAVREGREYEGRWEVGAPLDAAALDAIEAEMCAVLARARSEGDGIKSDRQRGSVRFLPVVGHDVGGGSAEGGGDLSPVRGGRDGRAPALTLGPHCDRCSACGACPALAAEALTLLQVAGWRDREEERNHPEPGGHRGGEVCEGRPGGVLPGGSDALRIADGMGESATASPTSRGLVPSRGSVPDPVLTPAARSHLAGVLPALRRTLDAIETAIRAGGPVQLANGQEYAPALEEVRRYKTAPTFEALAEIVGDEKANGAFSTSGEALKEALEGQPRGTWGRLKKAIEERKGVVVGARTVWRRRWPAVPVEVMADGPLCGEDRVSVDGGGGGGALSNEEPREEEADGEASGKDHAVSVCVRGVALGKPDVMRAPCSACGRSMTVRGDGSIRSHKAADSALRCAGSGQAPGGF